VGGGTVPRFEGSPGARSLGLLLAAAR